jgi:hypothetical protein
VRARAQEREGEYPRAVSGVVVCFSGGTKVASGGAIL